jgi:hypothetical protein
MSAAGCSVTVTFDPERKGDAPATELPSWSGPDPYVCEIEDLDEDGLFDDEDEDDDGDEVPDEEDEDPCDPEVA